jgi:hypothetical protein
MNRVKYDHALGNVGGVITKVAAFGIASPDLERSFHDIKPRIMRITLIQKQSVLSV